MVNIDELISGESFEEFLKKESGKPKKTPQEIEQNLFGGNKDLKAITEQVEKARAMITRKKLREVSQGVVEEDSVDNVDNVGDTVEYTQEELFLGLDKEEKPEEEEVEDENPEDKLIVYPEPEDGVDTDSERAMRDAFHDQSGGFYLITTEYGRAKRSLQMIGNNISSNKIKILEWDSIDGMPEIEDIDVEVDDNMKNVKLFVTLSKILYFIKNYKEQNRYVFVIKDLSFFIKNSHEGMIVQIIEKIKKLLSNSPHLLILTDMYDDNIHKNLGGINTIKFDLPTEVDLNRMILEISFKLSEEQQQQLTKKNIKKIIDILLGIEYESARIKLLAMFREHKNIDKDFFMKLASYKKHMIGEHIALRYIEPEHNWSEYIGRKNFKDFVEDLKLRIEEDNEFEKNKKGIGTSVLLAGQPGTGKSYAAECVANYLGKPLIKVDLSDLFGKFQGDMQTRFEEMRKIFLAVKDQAVFWFDEFEKMYPTGDDKISKTSTESNLEGKMLSLMEELEAYNSIIIYTSNQPDKISTPTQREGRINKSFYFSFPTSLERKHLIKFYLKLKGNLTLDENIIDILVNKTENFSESEINGFISSVIGTSDIDLVRLSKNKRIFLQHIDNLEEVLDISKLITTNHSMNAFFKDIKNLDTKELCEKYNITFRSDIRSIFETMLIIKEFILDKNSLIVQSALKIPMIRDYLNDNKELSKNKGNIADIIRQMINDLKLNGYLSEIVNELLDNVFDKDRYDEYEQIRGIDDIKDKNYILDNAKNREIILLLVESNIDGEESIKKHVHKQLKNIFDNREHISFEQFSNSVLAIFRENEVFIEKGVYRIVSSILEIYKNKIIFPEIDGNSFVEQVEERKKSIIWNKSRKSRKYCEAIHKWGIRSATSASKMERNSEDYTGNIIINFNSFRD